MNVLSESVNIETFNSNLIVGGTIKIMGFI